MDISIAIWKFSEENNKKCDYSEKTIQKGEPYLSILNNNINIKYSKYKKFKKKIKNNNLKKQKIKTNTKVKLKCQMCRQKTNSYLIYNYKENPNSICENCTKKVLNYIEKIKKDYDQILVSWYKEGLQVLELDKNGKVFFDNNSKGYIIRIGTKSLKEVSVNIKNITQLNKKLQKNNLEKTLTKKECIVCQEKHKKVISFRDKKICNNCRTNLKKAINKIAQDHKEIITSENLLD